MGKYHLDGFELKDHHPYGLLTAQMAFAKSSNIGAYLIARPLNKHVFHHYMKRLSQRGWGFFITEALDLEKGTARVRLENSAFVYQYGKVNRKVDYMFTGWFAGAMDQIAESLGYPVRTRAECCRRWLRLRYFRSSAALITRNRCAVRLSGTA